MTTKARNALTIVIKLGTSSIVSPTYPFLPHLQLLSSIAETVIKLREAGHRVVLVSSGAIGVGLRRMGLKERGKGLSHKQALAAIGQGRLIALWDNLFSQLDQPIAQILLTRMDISDRTRYLNAQNTFSELLNMGVVPIVNENDTVSVSEIKFGDNDTLSAISSAIVHADYLFLLTDVRCLYTDNPRNNPDAKPVRVVRDIQKVRQQVSTSTLGTSLGTGGMSTKLIAAELATAAGTTTVIMHSAHAEDIFGVIEGGAGPSMVEKSGLPSELSDVEETEETGPLCTRFLRKEERIKDRKWWIAHGLHAAGVVIIDEGAHRAITRKESGGRLLPAGVVRVEGLFASHQAVKLFVRRRRRSAFPQPPVLDSHPSIDESDSDSPAPSSPMRGPVPRLRPSPLTTTSDTPISSPHLAAVQPNTPTIQPAMSLSSSIASLDPLSKSVPGSPNVYALSAGGASSGAGISSLGQWEILRSLHETKMLGHDRVRSEGADKERSGIERLAVSMGIADEGASTKNEDEWEEVEIGKGLAQYNSVEIDRIKGLKSSNIAQVLGYSDSEHVVDSITFY